MPFVLTYFILLETWVIYKDERKIQREIWNAAQYKNFHLIIYKLISLGNLIILYLITSSLISV